VVSVGGLGYCLLSYLYGTLFDSSGDSTLLPLVMISSDRQNCTCLYVGIFIRASLYKLTIIGAFIIIFQSFFHYAVIMYGCGRNLDNGIYSATLSTEFEMRSTSLYFENLQHSTQAIFLLLGSL
jgi:hypothetical protein